MLKILFLKIAYMHIGKTDLDILLKYFLNISGYYVLAEAVSL